MRGSLPLCAALLAGCAGGRAPLPPPAPRVTEGFVDAGGGIRLYYRIVGSQGDTIVVLHGGPGFSSAYLAEDLAPLAAHHTLLFYDQRGAGRSTVVTDSAALDAERFAEDLEAVRRRFGLERLTLLAQSWGAAFAALYAARSPQHVGRLVLSDPISVARSYHLRALQTLASRRDSVQQRQLRELSAARLASPGDRELCRGYYTLWFRPFFTDSAAQRRSQGDFCAGPAEAVGNKILRIDRVTIPSLGGWDWRPALRAVTAPTLVIHGEDDYIPLESAQGWAAALPNARLLRIEHAGHFSYLDAPARWFPAVESFLASTPGGSAEVTRER